MTIPHSPLRGARLARKRGATRAQHASTPMTQPGDPHPERRGWVQLCCANRGTKAIPSAQCGADVADSAGGGPDNADARRHVGGAARPGRPEDRGGWTTRGHCSIRLRSSGVNLGSRCSCVAQATPRSGALLLVRECSALHMQRADRWWRALQAAAIPQRGRRYRRRSGGIASIPTCSRSMRCG